MEIHSHQDLIRVARVESEYWKRDEPLPGPGEELHITPLLQGANGVPNMHRLRYRTALWLNGELGSCHIQRPCTGQFDEADEGSNARLTAGDLNAAGRCLRELNILQDFEVRQTIGVRLLTGVAAAAADCVT